MKNIILPTAMLFFFNAASFAQSNDIKTRDSLLKSFNQLYGKKPDGINKDFKYRYFNDAFKPLTPIRSGNKSQGIYMPNAFTQKLQLTYLDNNGNGFLLYQSTPDNMFVLRPDSTFYSAMPVK